ncbi:MAG: hypothetical protein RLZ51_781 [Pseudomonadota bacterium]
MQAILSINGFRCRPVRWSGRSCQSGQSLIEGLVGLMALVPILFGAIWLARLIDLQQATVLAAREAAFECTVLPSGCPAGGRPDPASLQAFDRASSVLWQTVRPGDPDDPMRGISVHWEPLRFNTPFAFARGSASQSIPNAVDLLSNLAGPGRFGLSLDAGLSRARVSVSLAGSMRLESALAVLSDDWMARAPEGPAPDTVRSRVDRGQRIPYVDEALRAGWWPVRGLLQLASWVGLEPAASEFSPYFIDVDRVPPDRLGLSPWPLPLVPAPEEPPPDSGGGIWFQDGA